MVQILRPACSLVDQKEISNADGFRSIESKRRVTRKFSLNAPGGKIQLCKVMFLSNVNILEKYVAHTLSKFNSSDGRGKGPPQNKTSEQDKEFVKAHY